MRHGLVVLIAVVIACVSLALLFRPPAAKHDGVSGEAAIGGPFALTDQRGHAYSEKELLGHLSLVYFGFTHCTDICPVALTGMTQAIDALGNDGEKVTPIFITVDPIRDTVKQLLAYSKSFHPRLVALTGSAQQLKQAQQAYKAYAETPSPSPSKHESGMRMGHGDTENADEAGDRDAAHGRHAKHGDHAANINHSGFIYLMDEQGRYVTHFPHNAAPETMADAIRSQLRNSAK